MNIKSPKSFLFSKTMFIVSLLLLALFARATWSVSNKAGDTKDNLVDAEAELVTLQERESALKEDIEYLRTEEGVEAEIRDKFNVALAGEQVVFVVDKENEKEEVVAVPEEKKGFFQTIKGWFKKK